MRVMGIGGWVMVSSLAFAPATAYAGGTGTEGSSSGDTGSSSGTGSTSGSSSGSTGSVDDGGCGDCSPGTGDGAISLLNFDEGGSYMVKIPLDISTSPACECDDCGCYDAEAWQIRVFEGDVELEQCDGSSCMVELTLPVGSHVLSIVASYDFNELTREIQFSIVPPQDEGPFGTEGGGSAATQADAGSDGGSAGSTPGERGCGCTSDPPRGVGLVAVLALLGRRRRAAAH